MVRGGLTAPGVEHEKLPGSDHHVSHVLAERFFMHNAAGPAEINPESPFAEIHPLAPHVVKLKKQAGAGENLINHNLGDIGDRIRVGGIGPVRKLKRVRVEISVGIRGIRIGCKTGLHPIGNPIPVRVRINHGAVRIQGIGSARHLEPILQTVPVRVRVPGVGILTRGVVQGVAVVADFLVVHVPVPVGVGRRRVSAEEHQLVLVTERITVGILQVLGHQLFDLFFLAITAHKPLGHSNSEYRHYHEYYLGKFCPFIHLARSFF